MEQENISKEKKNRDLQPSPTETDPKKKRKAPLALTEEQEVDMPDWLHEHPMLYTKRTKQYKTVPRRQTSDLQFWAYAEEWYESTMVALGMVPFYGANFI
ncbi:hypothetical protein DPMN_131982 [Dreissena polymorpha]|uniref:Uncharacterized protein n=1 Tax=Dreissena polymorpha TaxID=45954 RepID=A0A9D4FU70_DREPO|nr:hypothetical protein DPMN_131982 [Dreissena polymorpha]